MLHVQVPREEVVSLFLAACRFRTQSGLLGQRISENSWVGHGGDAGREPRPPGKKAKPEMY